jgi:hypothetical protein
MSIGAVIAGNTPRYYNVANTNRTPPILGRFYTTAGNFVRTNWTQLLADFTVDDDYYYVPFPFTFYFNGTGYSNVSIGTNQYLTFGGGSALFSNIGPTVPAFNKILFDGRDSSARTILYLTDIYGGSQNRFVRIRFEGGPGAATPSYIYEFTFFNPLYTYGLPTIEILTGSNGSTTTGQLGNVGIYSSSGSNLMNSGYFSNSQIWANTRMLANTSYIIQGTDSLGTKFNVYTYNNMSYTSDYQTAV